MLRGFWGVVSVLLHVKVIRALNVTAANDMMQTEKLS
jgi:hypothetical protein